MANFLSDIAIYHMLMTPLMIIFFSALQVSNVQEIFEALQEYESDILSGDISPSDIITVISSVNPIMEVRKT